MGEYGISYDSKLGSFGVKWHFLFIKKELLPIYIYIDTSCLPLLASDIWTDSGKMQLWPQMAVAT